MKIISGGQSGADLGALISAKSKNISTGGYIPKGFLTEDGPNPKLKDYNLIEMDTTKYPPRTKRNVESSDATIIFKLIESVGCILTERLCKEVGKPYLVITNNNIEESLTKIIGFTKGKGFKVLNIAGNRESKYKGIQEFVFTVISSFLDYNLK